MGIYWRFLGLSLAAVIITACGGCSGAEQFIIKDGEPNAEIVVAEVSPRMTSFAALELQYYLKKMTGAKVPIVFEKSDEDNIKIYVGKSKYTDEMGIDDKDLKYGAFRMISGKDYLVLLGHDKDYHPPKPYAYQRNKMDQAYAEWDKKTEKYTDLKWGSPVSGTAFKKWWRARKNKGSIEEFMVRRYGKDNVRVWNPKEIEWQWGNDYYEGLKNGYTPGFWEHDMGGSLNAVFSFLRGLGAEWYMPGEIGEVIPELKTISLPQVNKIEKPDFALRGWFWYNYSLFPFGDVMWARRIGMSSVHEVFGVVGHAHGLAQVHARKEMQEKHPEYYALDKNGKRVTDYRGRGHVCFSSKGFFNETVKYCRFMFDEYDAPHVSLFPMDGFHHCQCEDCKKLSSSDLVWGFVDRVARELYKTHPDRLVSCGAYTPYVNPPSNVEQFTPNVVVLIGNSGRPYMDEPKRWKNYTEQLQEWKSKVSSGKIMRFENNLYHLRDKIEYPLIHPRNMARDIKYLKGLSLGECNEASQRAGWKSPGLDHLHYYIQGRFLWDADQDIEKVLAEYHEKFYGPAAKEMKTALDFAEAKYGRRGGRNYRLEMSLQNRVKFLELLHKARGIAGDTIYGKRIDVILGELVDIEKLREELKAKGNPRDNALQIEAYNLNAKAEKEPYKLRKRLIISGRPEVDTYFTVNWTEKSLVFDIRCEEPDMSSIKVGENVWDSDSIVLLLESPYHSYYQIDVDTKGRVFDYDRAGYIETRWASMADVKIEKAKDYWTAKITLPVALVGEEGAEGDPMNYVVSPRIKPGQEWFFNLARRRYREKGGKHSLARRFVLCKSMRDIQKPDAFARLVIK